LCLRGLSRICRGIDWQRLPGQHLALFFLGLCKLTMYNNLRSLTPPAGERCLRQEIGGLD